MRAEAERTKKIKTVQVPGRTLDDALQQASLELSIPLRSLEYEVLDRGSKGIMGIKGTPCRIVAYEALHVKKTEKKKSTETELAVGLSDGDELKEDPNRDGRFSVRLTADGAMVKVFPPVGAGAPITLQEVLGGLQSRDVVDIDMSVLTSAVKLADQMWVRVGTFEYFPGNNAALTLEVLESGMKAYATLQRPGVGGADLSTDDINGFLLNNSIVHGILEDVVQELEDFPVYDSPQLIAQGTVAVNGADAEILYNFETEPDKIHIQEEEDGSVNFKELNRIQNVVKGQTLARMIPPERGQDGQTLYGIIIPSRDGVSRKLPIGKNVEIGGEGSTIIASVDGHVLLKSGKINVETILVISGNVDLKTGNVNALGSVDIKGNVEDGYSVTAQGNIEVSGYVSRANLNAGGDIFVARGIHGGEGDDFGHIIAGKNIWSSFIQNANAKAGEFVIVNSGIVNSDIVAQRKVLCKGKRAKIVGGHIRASEEVNAVIFGSVSGVSTIIEVGFDPKVKEEIDQLVKERDELEEVRSSVHLNIQGLIRQIQIKRIRVSPEKKKLFSDLRAKFDELNEQLSHIDAEIHQRQDYLDSLITQGKMSASKKVMAGVVLRIRDVEYPIRDPYESAITFVRDGEYIRTMKYQDIEEDITRS